MKLNVLSVAYPFAPVRADAVGGAEQIVASLDAGLTAAGHRSVVLACAGSRVDGVLDPLPPVPATIDAAARARAHVEVSRRLQRWVRDEGIDVVHMHGVDFTSYLPDWSVPTVVTLHLPLAVYGERALVSAGRRAHLVCVSAAQRAAGGAAFAHLAVIGNGVALAGAAPQDKDGHALCLARICAEKGLVDAVEGARRAGLPLRIAGAVFPYPEHERYFREDLAPRLDGERQFIGPIAGADKQRLLSRARCVIVPSLVAETSSLVAMEALAAGTPVVARRVGALPGIVRDGETGFLFDDLDGLVQALARCQEIDAEACRRDARERFGAQRMIDEYLGLYRQLTAPSVAVSV